MALLFSLVCNCWCCWLLGDPDLGLFLANLCRLLGGGLAMLAIGMVASFLTGNLTVGFVLGVLFNAPLAFADSADVITGSPQWTLSVKQWSIAEQFRDFARGVISFSARLLPGIVAVMLYLCMVLIGRRHWRGPRRQLAVGHYLVRALALGVAAVAVVLIVQAFDLRADITAERLSSLSPDTCNCSAIWTPRTSRCRSTPTSAPPCRKTTCRRG